MKTLTDLVIEVIQELLDECDKRLASPAYTLEQKSAWLARRSELQRELSGLSTAEKNKAELGF